MPGAISENGGLGRSGVVGTQIVRLPLSPKPPESGQHSADTFEGGLGAGPHAGPGSLDDSRVVALRHTGVSQIWAVPKR